MSTIRCQHCNSALVLLEVATLKVIKKTLRPNFRTLGDAQTIAGKRYQSVCPSCDSYALGIEIEQGFPFLLQTGEVATVHDLNLNNG